MLSSTIAAPLAVPNPGRFKYTSRSHAPFVWCLPSTALPDFSAIPFPTYTSADSTPLDVFPPVFPPSYHSPCRFFWCEGDDEISDSDSDDSSIEEVNPSPTEIQASIDNLLAFSPMPSVNYEETHIIDDQDPFSPVTATSLFTPQTNKAARRSRPCSVDLAHERLNKRPRFEAVVVEEEELYWDEHEYDEVEIIEQPEKEIEYIIIE